MNSIKYANDGTTQSDRTIHTPSSYARKNLNYVQETGVLKSLKTHSCIRENLESFLFFVCVEGAGKVETGGKEYEVNAGDCVLLNCRKHYAHTSSEDKPWKIMWVHFNGKEAQCFFELFEEGNEGRPVFTPEGGIDEYVDIIENIQPLLPEKKLIKEIEASCSITSLLFSCLKDVVGDGDMTGDGENELDKDDFSSLREAVNEHCDEEGLERILSIQYGLQPQQLNELFKEKYGISLEEYIINRKMNKAKELLKFTIKPIQEVAEESGIRDVDMLRKLFLDLEEMSPEDYRKKWAQWIKS